MFVKTIIPAIIGFLINCTVDRKKIKISRFIVIVAICQLIFVKPRKMGRVTLIISFIATVGMAVGYYFIDKLLPLLDFVKGVCG